jgi:hypothetical protein
MIIKGVLDSTRPGLHNGLRKIRKGQIFNLQYEYPHTKKYRFSPRSYYEVHNLTFYFCNALPLLNSFFRWAWQNWWFNPHRKYKFIGPFKKKQKV